jgi:hypothetical protein
MRLIIAILFISLSASAQVDPVLKPFFERFKIEASRHNVKFDTIKLVSLKFPNLKEFAAIKQNSKETMDAVSWYGVNFINNKNGKVFIFINASWFYGVDDILREYIIFHEFGHCFFNIKRIQGVCLMDCEQSNDESYACYKLDREAALNQLFGYAKAKGY